MRLSVVAAIVAIAFGSSSPVAVHANSTTLNGVTFDFDAPAPPLTRGQNAFFQKYKEAVNRHDEAALMSLENEGMKHCAAVDRQTILKDLKNTIPDDAQVRFFPVSDDLSKLFHLDKLMYAAVQPTGVLGIDSKKGTILRSVRQEGETITLVPYCLTEKGKVKQNGL